MASELHENDQVIRLRLRQQLYLSPDTLQRDPAVAARLQTFDDQYYAELRSRYTVDRDAAAGQ